MSATREIEPMDLAGDLAKIEQQWGGLDELLADERRLALRDESVSAWSVGQQLAHVGLVLRGIARAVGMLLEYPKKDADGEPNDFGRELLIAGEIPRGRGVAPEAVRAEDAPPTANEIRETLAEARGLWDELARKAEAIETTPSCFPHHHLGPLNAKQWTRFISIHTAHHLKIIDDIIAGAAAGERI